MKHVALLLTLVGLTLTSQAHAGHIGGFLGESFLSSGFTGSTSARLTGGLDLAVAVLPNADFGVFYQQTSSNIQTLIGAELNFYPMITKTFYLGAKSGNANINGGNHLAFGPAAGFNMDILPYFISFGVDATYFLYTVSGLSDLSVLGDIKIWF